jgi:CO/xanthine dehydrogenase FAD-binding subunit
VKKAAIKARRIEQAEAKSKGGYFTSADIAEIEKALLAKCEAEG